MSASLVLSGVTVATAADPIEVAAVAVGAASATGSSVVSEGTGATSVSTGLSQVTSTIPVEPSQGVTVDGNEQLTIGLPNAAEAAEAAVASDGTVVYDNRDRSSTVPTVLSDGSLQIATVINRADAPREYRYDLSLPENARLVPATDGGATVVTTDGTVLGEFKAPWAKDAKGVDVPTSYLIDGSSLIQLVEHSNQFAYPVVADPTWNGNTVTYSVSEVREMYNLLETFDTACKWTPLPYVVGVACTASAKMRDAIYIAYYQNKQLQAQYISCGYNYCSYYIYKVVS